MKKLFFTFGMLFLGTAFHVHAQSLSPQVIATSGGYYSNAAGSLSFTVGETVTPTITSGGYTLTQGFQQPFDLTIDLTAYLQGYYVGSGQMTDVLYNQGVYGSPSTVSDSVTIELHNATAPYALAFSTKKPIGQNGNINIKGLGAIGQQYYIVVKNRNHLETWSANPVLLNSNTTYNFSNAANKAYADNQVEVETGVFAMYSGDVNQDYSIDVFDYLEMDPDIVNGNSGYLSTDTNGDGVVDVFDYILVDPNIVNGIGAAMP